MASKDLQLGQLEAFESVALEVAKEAGRMIRETCGNVSLVETKQSFADLVTETDKNVERFVFGELKRNYPEHRFIGEEGTALSSQGESGGLTDEPTWIVDPVDGTTNFVHTNPDVAVCIGLSIGKVPVLGVVYCPARDQLFTGRRGNGAYRNGQRVGVRCSSSLRDSLIATELGSDRSESKRDNVFKNLQSVGWQCHGIRALGSAAMNICAVAQGHFNGFYEFGLHCWDMCAPVAILVEAGGFVCDTTGEQEGDKFNLLGRRLIVACNETIARQLSQAMVSQLTLASD